MTARTSLIFVAAAVSGGVLWGLSPAMRAHVSDSLVSLRLALGGGGTTREDLARYIKRNALRQVGPDDRPGTPGPLRVSRANPRYFSDPSGRIVYLAGSHTWLNFQDGGPTDPPQRFDYALWLDFLQSQGHNFFRLWRWEQAKWSVELSQPWYFEPQPYERVQPGGPPALDGKPKFDLTRFNEAYFQRLRQRVREAGERGIYVSVMLFNGFSVAFPKGYYADANPWHGHPFNAANNVNGIDGDLNRDGSGEEIHELRDARVTALQEAYVRKVVDTLNDLDNVLYEISNESHGASIAWQYHMIDLIHDYERSKPKRHPVGMTAAWPNSDNAALYRSNADWVSPIGSLHERDPADGRKVVVADTDHLCGHCGDVRWAWTSFVRGENLLFMDRYDDGFRMQRERAPYDLGDANDTALRKNMGYIRALAAGLDLASMRPAAPLATTGLCLANPAAGEYVVYLPVGGRVIVDLTASRGPLRVRWLDVRSGAIMDGAPASGGSVRAFSAPFSAPAVLLVAGAKARTPAEEAVR